MWREALILGRGCPTIELTGFRRVEDLERRVIHSPVAVILVLIGAAGAIYALWDLRRGVEAMPHSLLVGYGAFIASYLGLLAYYFCYRFPRVRCPDCSELMPAFLADMDNGPWRRFIQALELGGRYYRRPHDEDDRRCWIRQMRLVRACPGCQTFIECSYLHDATCTEEELALLEQRTKP